MASQSYAAMGCKLAQGNGASPEVFTPILEAMKVKGPGEKLDTAEVTNLDSQGVKEFIATLRDSGELTFEVNYTTPASGTGLSARDLRLAISRKHYTLTLPMSPSQTTKGDVFDFYGFTTSYEPSYDETKQISASITMKITGLVNLTEGS